MLAPRNVCFISVKFLYIPEQTFSSFPNCLKNNPLQPSLSPKQKKFSFSEKHLVFSNVWISINNPRFPLHKDINNCSTLKPPCLRFPEWGEWERRHQWGSLQGDPCWDRGGAAQRWLLGPRGMQELFWLGWRPPPEGIFDDVWCFEQSAGLIDCKSCLAWPWVGEGNSGIRKGRCHPTPEFSCETDVSGGASLQSYSRLEASHQS